MTDLRVDWADDDPIEELAGSGSAGSRSPTTTSRARSTRRRRRASVSPATSDRHPLDPLDAAELARAVAIARDAPGLSDQVAVVSVEAREPEKADYLAWKSSGPDLPREAFLVLLDNGRRRGVEAVVSLDDDRLVSCADLAEGVQPAMHGDEFVAVAAALRADEGFVEALRRRGIDDPAIVHVEPWSSGTFEPGPARQARTIAWVRRDDNGDNPFSRPLYGLVAAVDLNDMTVLRIDDHGPGTPPPSGAGGDYRDGGGRPYRDDLRPISITQPDGPSFELDGHHIALAEVEICASGSMPREGLMLHDIGYTDAGRATARSATAPRSRRWSCPTATPSPTHHCKNVFDIGEYGLGALTNSLALGCDCLGEIPYFDAASPTPTASR